MGSIEIDNKEVEKVTVSLVREYLLRKGYFEALTCLTKEAKTAQVIDLCYTSRRSLGKDLRLENLMRINKLSENPLRSMLEVLIKCFVMGKVCGKQQHHASRPTGYYNNNSLEINAPLEKNYDDGGNRNRVSERRRRQPTSAVPRDNGRRHEQQVQKEKEDGTTCRQLTVYNTNHVTDLELSRKDENFRLENNKLVHQHQNYSPTTPHIEFPTINELLQSLSPPVQDQKLSPAFTKHVGVSHEEQQQQQEEGVNVNKQVWPDRETSLSLQEAPPPPLEVQFPANVITAPSIIPFPSTTITFRFNGEPMELSLENVSRIKSAINTYPGRSPLRGASLRNTQSEDGGSDSEENIDGPYPPPQILQIRSKSTQQIPSSLFSKVSRNSAAGILASPSGESALSIINALETKQNLLAEATLSTQENEIRQAVEAKSKSGYDIPDIQMTLEDIEDDEVASGLRHRPNNNGNRPDVLPLTTHVSPVSPGSSRMIHIHKPGNGHEQAKPECVVKTMDTKTWASLKASIFGPKGTLLDGWHGQGFTFNPQVPFGLAQRKGGPCGVLAVVQSLILKNLLFGSEFFDEDDIEEQRQRRLVPNLDDNSAITSLASKRMNALVAAILEILWKCAIQSPPAKVSICLSGSFNITAPATEIYIFSSLEELKKYISYNIHRFDCISMVYSVVLTRGIERIQEDMDFPDSPLLGNHGYCTQELINLFTVGKAISNAFDNQVVLGEKVLKGISSRVDIGFLSLFEHYDSCQVGLYLKNPRYPLWIVCSESHFSVLFSNDASLTKTGGPMPKQFHLYYYDGLARQEQLIKLTIDVEGNNQSPLHQLTRTTLNNNNCSDESENLVPPLEKCIRTKWKNASVTWNNTDPIL